MMKRAILFLLALGFTGLTLYSQVVINQSDMPGPGDTLRVSLTNTAPAGYARTAMDTAWNFSALEALSQRIDTFVMATATPSAYQLFFVLLGGANLASPRNGSPIPGLPVSQGFTFYKNSSASFSELGSAYTVQGLPLPAKYDNPDVWYTFPLQPGSTWSSTASFAITVPNTIYFSTQRFRTNIVDGWGNLTTPFGTFQTIRVKSTIVEHDSLYIDSLSTGFPFNRNITEYKWLGKNQGVPLMQVSEEGTLLTTTYRDLYRMSAQPLTVSLGPDTAVYKGTTITLHASVSGGTPPYQVLWNTLDTGTTKTVTVQDIRTYSVVVIDALQNFTSDQVIVSIRYPPGIGELAAKEGQASPNPTTGRVNISLPERCERVKVRIFTAQGAKVGESDVYPETGNVMTDLSDLPPGLYLVQLSTGSAVYMSKVQVIR